MSGFGMVVSLEKSLCPCSQRGAFVGGMLATGTVTFGIRVDALQRFLLRVECATCGAAVEVPINEVRVAVMVPPMPALTMRATQAQGKA